MVVGELCVLKIRLRKIFSFLIFVAFVASIFMYPNFYKRQVNKVRGMYYVAQGDKYLRKTQFQKAIDLYKKGLGYYPEHYGAWLNLGNIYIAYEDYYSALDAYDKAIQYNPNYVIARMDHGIVSAEKMGDFNTAIDQYQYITGIRKRLVYIPFVFNNLRSYKTNIGLAYYNMGVAYRQKSIYSDGDITEQSHFLLEAIKAYKEAIKYLKDDYDAFYNLALAYHLNKDYNLAGLNYCRAIELGPMNYEAHYNLAVLLQTMKHYKEAYEEMEKANTLIGSKDPNSPRQTYMFDVMSDVTQRVLLDEEGREYVRKRYEEEGPDLELQAHITYENGKVVATEELDEAILKNFATCKSRHLFLNPDEDL